jgi:ABC-type branched-subunit amino acid transport system ATPase component
MIEIHQLAKHYGAAVAVDGLSFTVRPGRVTGFLGPNGAGKSTTMRVILGLDAPSSGRPPSAGSRMYGCAARCTRWGRSWTLGLCMAAGPPATTCWPSRPVTRSAAAG